MVNIENSVGVGLVLARIVFARLDLSGRYNLLAPPRLLRRLRFLATRGGATGLCSCPDQIRAPLLEFSRSG